MKKITIDIGPLYSGEKLRAMLANPPPPPKPEPFWQRVRIALRYIVTGRL